MPRIHFQQQLVALKDKLLAMGERYEPMIAADRAADARYR